MSIFGAAKRGLGMLGKPRGVFKVKRSKTHGKEIPTMAAKGGRIGFKQGGAYGPLRGTTAGGVAKAFRGPEGFKQSQALQKKLLGIKDTGLHKGSVRKATSPKVMGTQRPKTKSDFRLKKAVKQIQKMPDKTFKYNNPGTRKAFSDRTKRWSDVPKTDLVKGSIGKKKYIQDWKAGHHRMQPKAKGGRIGFKRAGPVTKSDLARSDLWRKRQLKKRANAKRKSKWDIYGGIAGHPLNPLRVHAEGKAYDFSSMRKDVYGRTRDDLKKSRDPNVKGVAEGFQKMDWKDKARSDPRYEKGTKYYEEHSPKLIKRTHGRLGKKTGGRIGLQFGGPPSIDAKKIAKEKKREQYYKKHGRPGEFEKKAREDRAKLVGSRKTLAVSDPHKRTRHSVYGLKDGGKPHSTKEGRDASLKRSFKRHYEEVRAAFPGDFKRKKKRKLR